MGMIFLEWGRDSYNGLGSRMGFTAACYVDTFPVKVLNVLNDEFNPVLSTWCNIIQFRNCDNIVVFTELLFDFISVFVCSWLSRSFFIHRKSSKDIDWLTLWKFLIDGQYLTRFSNIWEMRQNVGYFLKSDGLVSGVLFKYLMYAQIFFQIQFLLFPMREAHAIRTSPHFFFP